MATRIFIKSTVMLALLFTSSAAFAQKRMMAKQPVVEKTPVERAENQAKWMKQTLAITDDQYKKAYDVVLDFSKKVGDIRASKSPDKRGQMTQAIENKNAALKNILSPEQFQKYLKHVAEMQQNHKRAIYKKESATVKHN